MDNKAENKGLFEETEQRLRKLMAESRDPEYTVYLKSLFNRLIQERHQVDLLKLELDRSYQLYQRRVRSNGASVQQTVCGAGVEAAIESVPMAENTTIAETKTEQDAVAGSFTNAAESTDASYFNMFDGQEKIAPDVPKWQGNTFPESKSVLKKKNAEFTVGASVLSVVGAVFILAALVTLGMTLMGGLFKGICLYGIALAFLLVSELVLYRRWPMLGTTISAIGIGGLYLSTAVNYLGLHNFNMWVTLVISFGITLFTVFLSRKRDSVFYRIIGLIAGYLCFFTVKEGITDAEFMVVSGMILLMNLMMALLPVKKTGVALNITHMTANTIFTFAFIDYVNYRCDVGDLQLLMFALASVTVPLLLLVLELIKCKKQAVLAHEHTQTNLSAGMLVTYYISSFFHSLFVSEAILCVLEWESRADGYCFISQLFVVICGLLVIGVLCFYKCDGWQHIYIFMNVMTFFIYMSAENIWVTVCGIVLLAVISKLVSLKDNTALRVNDMITTVVLCLCIISQDRGATMYLLLGGLAFSVLMIRYWQTAYEILLMGTLVFYVTEYLDFPIVLQLPAVVGILLVSVLVFNNVKRWHGKNILVFNISALVVQAFCFLGLMRPIYWNTYITYLCMLVFGLATIIITFQEKYHMNFKGKHMVLAIFLTYMAFVFKTSLPVVNSVLMMASALISVGIGFAAAQKSVRIYGLILSLLVCGKLVLYDFFKAATLQKTILLFAVGCIALLISAIYIVLKKKNSHTKADGIE